MCERERKRFNIVKFDRWKKMGEAAASEMLIPSCHTVQHHIPEDGNIFENTSGPAVLNTD
jgi:hypothetical protein